MEARPVGLLDVPGAGGEDEPFRLRPNRGRWGAMLARSAAAERVTQPADLSGAAPPRPQRAAAAGAALAGAAGVGGLVALASLRPDLGGFETAALLAAAAAAGLPAALCARSALSGSAAGARVEPVAAEGAPARRGAVERALARMGAAGRRARRDDRERRRAVKRLLADIAVRERRLAEGVAAVKGGERDPAPAVLPEPAGTPASMPREIALALADLEARERLHAGRAAAGRRAAPAAVSHDPDPAAPATRRHERIRPRVTRTTVALADGRRLDATVLDVSQSGVAVEGDLPGLWIGSLVTVGSRRAMAVRVLPRGMAFEFSMPVPAAELTADFVL